MQGRFPAPYLNETKENDPIMKRVDQDKGEIGSRSSGMPSEIKAPGMGINHVGTSAD